MTREAIRQYIARQRERYLRTERRERGRILDEIVEVTGYHRKSVLRLLAAKKRRRSSRSAVRRGRPVVYGPEVAAAAVRAGEAAGWIGARRLHPFVGEIVERLREFGEWGVSSWTTDSLLQASPATLDRMLASQRVAVRLKFRRPAGPLTGIRRRVPVRTFAEWDGAKPGFVQADTVAHCGHTVEGFHLWTVTVVDVATGWVEMDVVWGKTQVRVGAAIRRVRRRLPVPMFGLSSDNGTEFMSRALYEYCETNGITFTRTRPYRKNDNAHVEQKNGAVVRRLAGYGRYASPEAFSQLQKVYSLARLQANFFQPVRKLVGKSREGPRETRIYDEAATPYQRMLASGALTPARKVVLEKLYRSINPLQLNREIDREASSLHRMAVHPGDPAPWPGTRVTTIFEAQSHLGNRDF